MGEVFRVTAHDSIRGVRMPLNGPGGTESEKWSWNLFVDAVAEPVGRHNCGYDEDIPHSTCFLFHVIRWSVRVYLFGMDNVMSIRLHVMDVLQIP